MKHLTGSLEPEPGRITVLHQTQQMLCAGLLVLAGASFAACNSDHPLQSETGSLSASMASVERASVHWLSDLSNVNGAMAKLTRTESGASFSFRTTGLEKGHVVTRWWVIFNNPDECDNPIPAIGSSCNVPDLFDPDVQGSVLWGGGNIVGNSGKSTIGGHLREGEITTFHPVFVGSPGLLDAMGAEIHLVIRTHGPAIPKMIKEMRTTFEGGCTPGSSLGFGDGPNECADLQVAAFAPPS